MLGCGMQARHGWVFTMVDQSPDSNDYQLAQVFQGLDKDSALKKMKEVKGWLQALPLFKRPLVKTSVQVRTAAILWGLRRQLSMIDAFSIPYLLMVL